MEHEAPNSDGKKHRESDEFTTKSSDMPLEGEASEGIDSSASSVQSTTASLPSLEAQKDGNVVEEPVLLPGKRGSQLTRYLFREL
jgi:hypothetical protein